MTSSKKHKRQDVIQPNTSHQPAGFGTDHQLPAHEQHKALELPPHPMPDDAHKLAPHPHTEVDHQLAPPEESPKPLELSPHPTPDDAHKLSPHPHIEADHQLQAHASAETYALPAHPEIGAEHQLPAFDASHASSGVGPWTQQEQAFLSEAAQYLEHPSFLMRVAERLGKPLEWLVAQLPEVAHQAAHKALEKALEVAVMTLPEQVDTPTEPLPDADWTPTLHTLATAVSGALGGALGVMGLAVELPFSTGVIMRSIASIAQSYGEDIRDPAVQLECLAVLSHGGPPDAQASMDSAYLTSRTSLTVLLREASGFMARVSARELAEAVAKGTAPRVLVLLAQIANRFGVVVSQKFFAQALPLIGALGGGFVNAAFADHFQRVARYHFGIRSLERRYGSVLVLDAYKKVLNP